YADLIKQALDQIGVPNPIVHFDTGRAAMDYLFIKGKGPHREAKQAYLLILDVSLPDMGGVEILRELKAHPELRKMPIIMLTASVDPVLVKCCHALGCSNYVTKPDNTDDFLKFIKYLGFFVSVMKVPTIN
ncbi:MAG: response regulator, partial [bacterium]|nr:response regulator [bacterium]